jgi:hypothetical protein
MRLCRAITPRFIRLRRKAERQLDLVHVNYFPSHCKVTLPTIQCKNLTIISRVPLVKKEKVTSICHSVTSFQCKFEPVTGSLRTRI